MLFCSNFSLSIRYTCCMFYIRMPWRGHIPAHNHELPFRSTGSETLPQVHGKNGAGTVKDGGQRGHESSNHHSHHQAPQSWEERRTVTIKDSSRKAWSRKRGAAERVSHLQEEAPWPVWHKRCLNTPLDCHKSLCTPQVLHKPLRLGTVETHTRQSNSNIHNIFV